ncbi:NACHT domain-containing protein [Thioflexithrix psekupsensis]|uniref:NACHT domain-containing protein n=1 Tax=Thioflexithrix psekupsensis TaxID=1570016 RepID=A0A251X578_9GAMM|nr:NACHT domain-containing protein [Thioflexithrix psekupsensis]OUD12258.1 hypothetical protein TPSD3_14155 [Thioflexithrix psekupsensis]
MFSWFSSFKKRYYQSVIYEHRIFNVRGLRTMGTFTLELEKVFVELRIAPSSNPQQINFNPLSNRELLGSRPIWDFLKNTTPHQSAVFAIIGAPGSGKTTLLQHLALTLAAKKEKSYGLHQHYLPILLFLRNHTKYIVDYHLSLAELIQQHFADAKRYPHLNPPRDWFVRQLKKQSCLILLDGLDEIADLRDRQFVSNWIEQQVFNYPHCQFIITARPQGYLSAPLHRAHVLEIQAFTLEQVRHFIHAWYLANEVVSFGHKIDEGIRLRARQGAEDLLSRLNTMQTLSALTVNPLLLTMIAMVHRYRGQLPGRRVELYGEICDVLLGHWRQAIGIKDSLTAAQKRVVLQPLAAQMMLSKIRDISTAAAIAIIADPMESVGLDNKTALDFLMEVQASSGLLLEREPNVWSFAHLTFQEYLTASHLLEQKTTLYWSALVNDSWWHETLLLYAAQSDATLLVKSCLQFNTILALTLAADCLEEARELDRHIRIEVHQRLTEALISEDREKRRLAAEVRLNQRLKSLHRLDEMRDMDLSYLTWAEYQLFLDDNYAQGYYCQPDHWQQYCFRPEMALLPVSGIRAEDATAFCAWLNAREGGKVRYRLPTSEEALLITPPPSFFEGEYHLATWCQNNETYQLIFSDCSSYEKVLKNIKDYSFISASSLDKPETLIDYLRTWQFSDLDDKLARQQRHQLRIQALSVILAFDFDSELAYAFNFHQDIDLILGHDRTFEWTHAYVPEKTSANSPNAHIFIRDLARDMVIALDLAKDSISALELARDIALAQPIDNRALARSLVRARDLSHHLEQLSQHYQLHDMKQARDMAKMIVHDLSADLARARGRNSALARVQDLTQARAKALDRARTLAFALTRALVFISEFEPIYQQIEQHINEAKKRVEMMLHSDDVHLKRLAQLVQILLDYMDAPKTEKKQAWQIYLLHLVACLLEGYRMQAQMPAKKWFHPSNDLMNADKALLVDLYWWLQMTIARQKGELVCWEGIRIVRQGMFL